MQIQSSMFDNITQHKEHPLIKNQINSETYAVVLVF